MSTFADKPNLKLLKEIKTVGLGSDSPVHLNNLGEINLKSAFFILKRAILELNAEQDEIKAKLK